MNRLTAALTAELAEGADAETLADVAMETLGNLGIGVAQLRRALFWQQRGRCFYCRRSMPFVSAARGHEDGFTIDHVTPLGRGGGNDWDNKVFACAPCNHTKGARMPTADELRRLRALRAQGIEAFGRDAASRLDAKHESPPPQSGNAP